MKKKRAKKGRNKKKLFSHIFLSFFETLLVIVNKCDKHNVTNSWPDTVFSFLIFSLSLYFSFSLCGGFYQTSPKKTFNTIHVLFYFIFFLFLLLLLSLLTSVSFLSSSFIFLTGNCLLKKAHVQHFQDYSSVLIV